MRNGQLQKLSYDADQVEFESMKFGEAVVDRGAYDERVAGALDDYLPEYGENSPQWSEEDLILDGSVGGIHEEIDRRIKLMKDSYPFELNQNNLEHRKTEKGFYEFLLSTSNMGRFSGEYKNLPRLFERTTAKIIAAYFGAYAESFHIGFPRDSASGISFQDAMKMVEERTGEFIWRSEDNLNPAKTKDEGCDFIVWLKHVDQRRLGQLFILGQCACGNNWDSKLNELQVNKFAKWFHPMTHICPVRAFATPYHVTDATLKEASRGAGLFFDRARLTMILDRAGDNVFDETTRMEMKALIKLTCNDQL